MPSLEGVKTGWKGQLKPNYEEVNLTGGEMRRKVSKLENFVPLQIGKEYPWIAQSTVGLR